MPQTLVLDSSNDTDTSTVAPARGGIPYHSKQKYSNTSAVGLYVDMRPSGYFGHFIDIGPGSGSQFFHAQSGKVIGVLRGRASGSSGGTATVTVGPEELGAGTDSLLTAHFSAVNVSEATNTTLGNARQDSDIGQEQVAREFITSLHNLITRRDLTWHEPAYAHNKDDNTIEISWWRPTKSLIFTIEPDNSVTFLKVWGPHIYNDMEEGKSPSGAQLVELWQWLYA